MNKQLLKNFIDLVQIDSISGEEQSIKNFITKKLEKIDVQIQEDDFGNLYKTSQKGEIMLTAHLDTVEPGRNICPIVCDNRVTSDGKTILGADNKAGVAIILTLLESLPPKLRKSIEVVFTVQEEIGMRGAYHFNTKLLTSKFGLSFDKSQFNFGKCLVLGCNYSDDFEIAIKGEASHASRPQPKLNPLIPFLEIFSKFMPGYIGEGETVNVGIVDGFAQVNSSPGMLVVKGDVRTRNKANADAYFDQIENYISKIDTDCAIQIDRTQITSGYSIESKSKEVQFLLSELHKFGFADTELIDFGSTTDAAAFSYLGFPTILMSCGVFNTHKVTEYVLLSEMEKAVEFCQQIASDFGN